MNLYVLIFLIVIVVNATLTFLARKQLRDFMHEHLLSLVPEEGHTKLAMVVFILMLMFGFLLIGIRLKRK